MFQVTTVDAKKDLSLAGENVHTPASRARLAGVLGVRNVRKPRKLGAKLGQFVDLIKRRGKDSLILRPRESHQPLLVCEVPQEPQGRLPPTEPLDLRDRRVDAIAKCLACDHERHYAVGLSCRQETFARAGISYEKELNNK